MEFKELVWKDITSGGVIVCSHCDINLCGVIKIEFRINHEPKENKYLLYNSIRKGGFYGDCIDEWDTLHNAQ